MELGFDHEALLSGGPFGTAETAELLAPDAVPALDWAGLRARFIAVHALRRTLIQSGFGEAPGGSFTQAGAQVLAATRESSPAVNPTALANLKGLRRKEASIVGLSHTGNRGLS